MLIFVTLTALLALLLIVTIMGKKLCAHARMPIGDPPTQLPVESVQIPRRRGGVLRAWWIPSADATAPIIIHFHGNRGNRTQVIQRGAFFHRQGYHNLLPDFQAHGLSDGENISFGYFEQADVRDWIAYCHTRYPQKKIGVIGLSLGGAACLIGDEPLLIDALVLEMVFPTLLEAIDNRTRLHAGPIGHFLTPILALQLKLVLGIWTKALRPIDNIQQLTVPKFIIAGEKDPRTTLVQSERFFQQAAQPKAFWCVPGAKHEDLHAFNKAAYEQKVLTFFDTWLRNSHEKNL